MSRSILPSPRALRLCLGLLAAAGAGALPALAEEQRSPTPVLSLLAGGDVTLGYHLSEFFTELRERGIQDEGVLRTYPFRHIAERTRRADLFWVNLEGTLTRHREPLEKNFNFRADPADVEILVEAGVDVVCLANNHAFDFGRDGLRETLKTLKRAKLASYGAGMDLEAARRPAVVRQGELSIGFLGYVYLGPESIEPVEIYATQNKAGVAGTHGDLERLAGWVDGDVRKLREDVDLVLVSFHWGREGSHVALPYQRRLARAAATAGADLVVGHHPHALQGYETLGPTLVAYSLGNLMFAGNWSPTARDAALLEFLVTRGADGRLEFTHRFHPIAVDRLPDFPFQPWFHEEVQAARVRRQMECYSQARRDVDCAMPRPDAPGSSGGDDGHRW